MCWAPALPPAHIKFSYCSWETRHRWRTSDWLKQCHVIFSNARRTFLENWVCRPTTLVPNYFKNCFFFLHTHGAQTMNHCDSLKAPPADPNSYLLLDPVPDVSRPWLVQLNPTLARWPPLVLLIWVGLNWTSNEIQTIEFWSELKRCSWTDCKWTLEWVITGVNPISTNHCKSTVNKPG